jgi:hypothetical protein
MSICGHAVRLPNNLSDKRKCIGLNTLISGSEFRKNSYTLSVSTKLELSKQISYASQLNTEIENKTNEIIMKRIFSLSFGDSKYTCKFGGETPCKTIIYKLTSR